MWLSSTAASSCTLGSMSTEWIPPTINSGSIYIIVKWNFLFFIFSFAYQEGGLISVLHLSYTISGSQNKQGRCFTVLYIFTLKSLGPIPLDWSPGHNRTPPGKDLIKLRTWEWQIWEMTRKIKRPGRKRKPWKEVVREGMEKEIRAEAPWLSSELASVVC